MSSLPLKAGGGVSPSKSSALHRIEVVRMVSELLARGIPAGAPIPLRVRFLLELCLVFRLVKDSDLTVRAASTAYTLVFAMVPLLTTSLAFFTAFSGLEASQESVTKYLYAWLLPGAAQEVQIYLNQFAHAAAAAGTVSSLVFLLSVLLLLRSLEVTYNQIWRVTTPRSWGDRVKTLAMFFLLGAIGVSLMVLVSREAGHLADQLQKLPVPGMGSLLLKWSYESMSLVLSWVLFFSATWVLPAAPVRKRAALLSGIIMGTAWHILKGGFSWYIGNFAGYDSIYGAVGTVPVFLLWLYLTLILFLAGAYLAYVHQNVRELVNAWKSGSGPEQGNSANTAFYAVAICVELTRAWYARTGPQDEESLHRRTGLNACLLAEALQALVKCQLVVPVATDSSRCYLLAVPPESLTPGEVVRAVRGPSLPVPLLDDAPTDYQSIQGIFGRAQGQEEAVLAGISIQSLLQVLSSGESGESHTKE